MRERLLEQARQLNPTGIGHRTRQGHVQRHQKSCWSFHRTNAPLKSNSGEKITDRAKQLDRWVEHYSELYSNEDTVCLNTLNSIERLPT